MLPYTNFFLALNICFSLRCKWEEKVIFFLNPPCVTNGEKLFCPFGRDSFPHEKGTSVQSLYTRPFSLPSTMPDLQKATAFTVRV